MRQCQIFYCDRHRERRCCRDCEHYEKCHYKCLNHPDLCKLVIYGKERQKYIQRIPAGED